MCLLSFSDVFMNLVRSADSFKDHAFRHKGRMAGFENFSKRFTNEKASLRGFPKTICAGESPQSGSGVFLSWRSARNNLSLFSVPFGPMFDWRRRFAVLTATSARPFD